MPWVYHGINGLETALVSFLLTGLLLVPPESRRARRVRCVLALALVVTRPEGVLLVGLAAIAVWLADRARFSSHHILLFGLSLGAFGLHTLARWMYHGDWIANSVRAKLLSPGVALPWGLVDLARFAFFGGGYGTFLVLAAAGAWLALRRRDDPESGRLLALLVFCLLAGFTLAASGGDSFYLWRFYVPLAPAFILCAARGLHLLAGAGRRGLIVRAAVCVVLALSLGIAAWNTLPQIRLGSSLDERWTDIGKSLARAFPPETRMALPVAGIIPFYSGLYTIDMLGLNERTIARRPPDLSYYLPGHQRHDGAYVLDQEPDLLILAKGPIVQGTRSPFPWHGLSVFERDVVSDPRFAERYEMVHLPLLSGSYVQIFASKRFLDRPRGSPR